MAMRFGLQAVPPNLDRSAVEVARLRAVARAQLVTGTPSVTYALIAEACGVDENTGRQWAKRRRDAKFLFGCEHDDVILFPSFQFDDDFDVRSDVGTINKALRSDGFSEWAMWHWWASPNGWLKRRTPLSLLRGAPSERVTGRLLQAIVDASNGEG